MHELVVKAAYSEDALRVYQAYKPEIALPALRAGRFVPPFRIDRMSWIKPSFNWMMYRSGYGTKQGQQVILAIDITRQGFEWALEHAALSKFTPTIHASREEWQMSLAKSPVRVQWDPARDWRLNIIEGERAIQIGLSDEVIERYVSDWIVRIEDVTPVAQRLAFHLQRNTIPGSLPDALELPYPLSPPIRLKICGV